ncbi:undecaprenyl-diphosphate phosphatase [Candidatus Pacearchaeota archaeon]|nr:MAG: undecaprenyl-diphosphate phosphatase [Candidatus Pacearchaeota archaeon]
MLFPNIVLFLLADIKEWLNLKVSILRLVMQLHTSSVGEVLGQAFLALLQGITEWLPISSSGHLALAEHFIGLNEGLAFTTAVHLGTLMAVFVYFGEDIVELARAFLTANFKSKEGKLLVALVVATIPAGVVGVVFEKYFESVFSNLFLVSLGFGVSALALFIAANKHKLATQARANEQGFPPSLSKALFVGVAQAVAIFPGVSRSGITIASALLLGMKEKHALKFSFLMAVPVILGANALTLSKVALTPTLALATLIAFVVGLGAIHAMFSLNLVSKRNLILFGLYSSALSLISFLASLVVKS